MSRSEVETDIIFNAKHYSYEQFIKKTPSPYQQAIYDFICNGSGNAVVSAVAGSGKTTTLINALNLIPEDKNVIFLAFNKSIAQEIQGRIPNGKSNISVKTVHSYGFTSIQKMFSCEIENGKYRKILNDIVLFHQKDDMRILDKYAFDGKIIKLCMDFAFQEGEYVEDKTSYFNRVISLCDLGRLNLVDLNNMDKGIDELALIAKKHDIALINGECYRAWMLIKIGVSYTFKVDFTDMIFMPIYYNVKTFTFDIVMVDECFPFDTYISTEAGKIKIGTLFNKNKKKENLPSVISFNEKTKSFEPKKIKNIWSNGVKEVYEIILGGKRKVKSTKNHKFLTNNGWVKMCDLKVGDAILSNYTEQPYHSIYSGDKLDLLIGTAIADGSIDKMSENIYRVKCIHGAKQEEYIRWKAEVLNAEIREVEENGFASTKAFVFTTKGFYFKDLDKSNIIKNLSAKSLALTFMDDGSLNKRQNQITLCSFSEYPLLVKELKNVLKEKFGIDSVFSKAKSSSTKNIYYYLRFTKENAEKLSFLISPFVHPSMDYKVFDKHKNRCDLKNWDNLYDNNFGCMVVSKEMGFLKKQEVFDMEIEDNHNFIVTSSTHASVSKVKAKDYGFIAHNCQDLSTLQRELMRKAIKPVSGRFISVGDPSQAIYGFAGSDYSSFQKLKEIPNTITLPLSVCYRCGSDIIELAKKLMPQIEASPNAKKGFVDYNASYKSLESGDMVICRNTAPLVSLCMKLLLMNKKSFVMGTDISKNLINLVESCRRKTEEFSIKNVFARIYQEKEKMISNICKKEKITIAEAKDSQIIASLSDKIATLEILSSGCLMADELIDKLKQIFSDQTDGICLSSIHKSKGLEADRVFIIHSELMPSKYAKQDWEKEQEKNLEYVAVTRAKSVLGYITDFDAYKDIESQDKGVKVKDSNYVGIMGQKSALTLTVIDIKEMNTSFGDTTLYTLTDSNGNIFTKFGSIHERFLISSHSEIEIGSMVEFNATIKTHQEYRGVKTNVISTISKI